VIHTNTYYNCIFTVRPKLARECCRSGVTLIEILVVVILSAIVLGSATLMMSRTTMTFQKGNELIDVQQLLKAMTDRMRSDIRGMTRLVGCSDEKLIFTMNRDGTEYEIQYEYDARRKVVTRKESRSGSVADFHGNGMVAGVRFQARPSTAEAAWINVSLKLQAPERKGTPVTSLSFVCQFVSRCLSPTFTTP